MTTTLNEKELQTVKDAKRLLSTWYLLPMSDNLRRKIKPVIDELDAMIKHDEWLERQISGNDPIFGR